MILYFSYIDIQPPARLPLSSTPRPATTSTTATTAARTTTTTATTTPITLPTQASILC